MGVRPLKITNVNENQLLVTFKSKEQRDFWSQYVPNIKLEAYVDVRSFRNYSFSEVMFPTDMAALELRGKLMKRLHKFSKSFNSSADDRPKLQHFGSEKECEIFKLYRNKPRKTIRKDHNVSLTLPATHFETYLFLYEQNGMHRLRISNLTRDNMATISLIINHLKSVAGDAKWLNYQSNYVEIALGLSSLKSLKFDPNYKIPNDIEHELKSKYGDSLEITFSNEIRIEKDPTNKMDLKTIPQILALLEQLKKKPGNFLLRVEGKIGEMSIFLDSQEKNIMKVVCYPSQEEIANKSEFEWSSTLLERLSNKSLVYDGELQSTLMSERFTIPETEEVHSVESN